MHRQPLAALCGGPRYRLGTHWKKSWYVSSSAKLQISIHKELVRSLFLACHFKTRSVHHPSLKPNNFFMKQGKVSYIMSMSKVGLDQGETGAEDVKQEHNEDNSDNPVFYHRQYMGSVEAKRLPFHFTPLGQ